MNRIVLVVGPGVEGSVNDLLRKVAEQYPSAFLVVEAAPPTAITTITKLSIARLPEPKLDTIPPRPRKPWSPWFTPKRKR